ncbi:MAG TPA: xanthine dehydrogenase family protein molybdopterin-binding subunit [Candidatus Dormibacteraeota bacterium]|nr:xanthine dehydrogenase family protein molybdopterin-binding subunit [Candidatus Dormibacteraeota bacterium]
MGPSNRGMRRQEGRAKVEGSTTFTADLDLPGLLHVQLVLSHLPSARVRSIDTSAARSAPGVVDVVTGADLPEVEAAGPDKPLAIDRVFYSGQPVAAVIAETETAAADAAALIVVDLEELPVVAGPEQAMKDDAPEVLESDAEGSEGDASMHGAATESESESVERPRNVSSVASYKRGDVESGLATADAIVKATYGLARVHHSFIEPHVSVVRPEPGGGVTIWAPTQGPFAVRDEIAKVIDAAPHEVRVISMPVGGGFGGKVMLLETLLVLLARRVRRPVRLALTRQQEFLLGHPAPAARFDLELGAKRDGTLVALRARYDYDNGASGGWHAGITGSFLGGTYRIPNFEITGFEVATNKTPADAYRAPGAPQAYFALESAMDELAIELGIDPIELRLHNASREGDLNADEEPWPRIAMVECLEAARRHPVYTAPAGPGEGVGIALGCWGGARSPAAAGCRVEPDGTVSILIGSPDISGSSTGLAMIAAEAFGIAPEKVRVTVGDTSYAPQGPMAAGSQVTYSVGGAVYEAALEARRQLLEIATDELEAAPEDLEIVDGHVAVKGVPDRFVEITRLVAMSTEFMGRHRPIQSMGRSAVQSASPSFTVHIARVRTDAETGAFQLTGYAAIQDVGRAINPPEAQGQVHGGAVQSLGRALGEQLFYDSDGQLRSGSFLDYELPTADQVPHIDVELVEVPSPVGPLGAKGVGEPPAIPGAAALANALARATGIRVREVPIDRSKLVAASSSR